MAARKKAARKKAARKTDTERLEELRRLPFKKLTASMWFEVVTFLSEHQHLRLQVAKLQERFKP